MECRQAGARDRLWPLHENTACEAGDPMKIVNHQFFEGASVCSKSSGVLLALEFGPDDAAFLQWKPDTQDAAQVLRYLRTAFAVTDECASNWRPEAIALSRVPSIGLLLITTESLMRDFCVSPAVGWLVQAAGNHLRIFLPCEESSIAIAACNLSMQACSQALVASSRDSVQLVETPRKAYWDFRQRARFHGLNQTNMALARAAAERDIPHYRIAPPGQLLQLGQGCFRQRMRETATDRTSAFARAIAGDKLATSAFLTAHGIPTSEPQLVGSLEQAIEVRRKLNMPVVVKPRSAGKGLGVTVDISLEADLKVAVEGAAKHGSGVIVERFVKGEDHRLLVAGGRFVAAARRVPAHAMGDGEATVRQLVEQLNRDPRRGLPFERLLEWIDLDTEATSVLKAAGLTLDAVPARGQSVPLRRTANISRGGTSIDVTDVIHPDNRALAEQIAQLIGLDVTGIDFLTPDIQTSWRDIPCAILEVNSSPGLRPHLYANPQRDVLGPIIDTLFPDSSSGRVPIAFITGSAGKTTTCRMLAAILALSGKTVGLATTQGIYVGKDQLRSGDLAGGGSARQLLLDPRVEAGVFELARGGLIKRGTVIDSCDVGAVLNVHDNHLGLDGVNSREELARVKRLVVENARRLAVLNADEPLCLAMRPHVCAPICLVTEAPDNPAVLEHRAAGGTAAVLDEEQPGSPVLKLYVGNQVVGEIPGADIPASWGGTYRPPIVNGLYAAAIAHGMGISIATIHAALTAFESTPQSNPGRMNFHERGQCRVLVTWADGREGMTELARFVRTLNVAGTKRLMICAMGNRPDSFISGTAGAAAGAFGQYVCSDWEALRGRAAGATAALLAQGLAAGGVPHDCVAVATDFQHGLAMAFDSARPGDLLVVISFISDTAQRAIAAHLNDAPAVR